MDQNTLLANLNHHIECSFDIAQKLGIENIFDKYKYREVQVASVLGHKVFIGASGGKQETNDNFGADATDQNGKKAEYKSMTVDQKDLDKLLGNNRRGTTLKVGGVYNGAYKDTSIEAYREIDHYFSVHYKGVVVAIAKVNTDHVCDTLTKNNNKRIKENKRRAAADEDAATTNCNTVKVEFTEGNPNIKFSYKNPEFPWNCE